MSRIARLSGISLALVLILAPALRADSGRWIHVRVDEAGDGAKIDVQVPVSMVSALMPTLQAKLDLDGRIDLGDGEMSLAEMRASWAAVKGAKDGHYVTIRDGDETLRIAKRDGVVHVDVTGGGRGERVKLRIPAPLVDAVLGGGDTVDVAGIVRALDRVPSGELIAVDDDDSRVRIWIDDRPQPAREDAP